MSHEHDNCTKPKPAGYLCNGGHLTSRCEYCDDEYCVSWGHCECKCHTGKTCGCGYKWEAP